jgi:hypothetical protein
MISATEQYRRGGTGLEFAANCGPRRGCYGALVLGMSGSPESG